MRERIGGIFSKISPAIRQRVIVITGITGLALIFLSSFVHTRTSASPDSDTDIPRQDTFILEYRKELEQELENIVSQIDGAGSVKILITMDSTTEDIYAVDRNTSESTSVTDSETTAAQRSEGNSYVIVKGKDGSEQTVLKTQRMPEIRGVLVVCDGGGSNVVREKVTAAVAGALGIARGKVVVVN